MPLFTKSVASIAALLAVPVFGVAIIGANYSSPILHHLIDIINGENTQTVAGLNAPNWSAGIPLAVPAGASAATSTSGSLATSTTYYFAVAALDGTGTTTLSSTASAVTQSSTTTNSVRLTWGAVTGATAYAVYFSTSTAALDQYFIATSTNGAPNTNFTFATSTGSRNGTNALTDTTAFSVKINPLGISYFNGGRVGVGTTSPVANLDIASGTVRAIGGATSTCNSTNAGTIQFQSTSGHFYGCLPSGTWRQLDN